MPRSRPRPRIIRSFLIWLAESRTRFKIPFRVVKQNEKYYLLLESVGNASLTVSILLTQTNTRVNYGWQGNFGNMALTNFVRIEKLQNGYRCKEDLDAEEWGNYIHEVRNIYPTVEEVWRVHVFEIILDTINSLTKYPWVELYEPINSNEMDVNLSCDSGSNTKQPDYIVGYCSFGGDECDSPPLICARLINSFEDRLQPELNYGLSGKIIPNPLYAP